MPNITKEELKKQVLALEEQLRKSNHDLSMAHYETAMKQDEVLFLRRIVGNITDRMSPIRSQITTSTRGGESVNRQETPR